MKTERMRRQRYVVVGSDDTGHLHTDECDSYDEALKLVDGYEPERCIIVGAGHDCDGSPLVVDIEDHT